jgi:hypothetical protein
MAQKRSAGQSGAARIVRYLREIDGEPCVNAVNKNPGIPPPKTALADFGI